eukprot:PhF_6_TR39669/c0_g1_i2/m.58897
MPPKPAERGKSKSPVRPPAGKGVSKAPATSSAVAATTKSGGARPPSPKKSGAGSTTTTTTTTTKKSTTTTESTAPPPPPATVVTMTPEKASTILQKLGRAFSDRVYMGSRYARKAREEMAKKSAQCTAKYQTYQSDRSRSDKSIADKERAKQAHQAKLQEDLNSAAFDGDLDGIKKAYQQGAKLHKKDSSGNVAIGEAAVNNNSDAVKLLLSYGADPNAKGAYDRTPLWRAAYNSHADVIKVLLEAGADPRIIAQQESPADKASGEAKQILTSWDVSKTDALLKAAADKRKKQEEEDKAEFEAIHQKIKTVLDSAQAKYDACKQKLFHARQEYETRIFELDCVTHDPTKTPELREIALQCVKQVENKLGPLEEEYTKSLHEFMDAKQSENVTLEAYGVKKHSSSSSEVVVIEIPLRQVAEVVLRDSERHLAKCPSKWPLVIDPSGSCEVFFRYRDTNVIDTFQPSNMEADKIRVAILGSLRYGKPLIVNLHDVPMLDAIQTACARVDKDLWTNLLNKNIKQKEVFMKLVKQPQDGERYLERNFSSQNIEEMGIVFLTSAMYLDEEIMKMFIPFSVMSPDD